MKEHLEKNVSQLVGNLVFFNIQEKCLSIYQIIKQNEDNNELLICKSEGKKQNKTVTIFWKYAAWALRIYICILILRIYTSACCLTERSNKVGRRIAHLADHISKQIKLNQSSENVVLEYQEYIQLLRTDDIIWVNICYKQMYIYAWGKNKVMSYSCNIRDRRFRYG